MSKEQQSPEQRELTDHALTIIGLNRSEWPDERNAGPTSLHSDEVFHMDFQRHREDGKLVGTLCVWEGDKLVAYSRTSVLEDIGRDYKEFYSDYFDHHIDYATEDDMYLGYDDMY